MRIALLCFTLALAACAKPPPMRDDVPDSEFRTIANEEADCFGSVGWAATASIERLRADFRGESGASEVRVTRRDEQTYAIDVQEWDSGHDERGYYHERQILELRDGAWCQTRILRRLVRFDSY